MIALGYVALVFFGRTPLPWVLAQVSYDTDVPFSLSLAGEALHHWPMSDPNVSGTPLYYYVAAHVDIAAASTVTGLPLALILFRLAIVPLVLLVVGQMVLAGRLFAGRAAVGVVAAALLLLVGEFDPEPWYSFPFIGYLFLDVWLSPTFLVGLVFFIAAVVFIGERIGSAQSVRTGWRHWLAIAVFVTACDASKPPTVAVLGGALVLLVVWQRWVTRRFDRNTAAALGLVCAVSVVFYALIYRHSALGLDLHPFGSFESMGWVSDARRSLGNVVGWPVGVVLGTLGLFGSQLVGTIALIRLRGRSLDASRLFLLALLIVGLLAFVLFHQGGNGQVYFSHYGLVAGTLLSAEGIVLLAARWPAVPALRSAFAIVLAAGSAVVLLVYGVVVRFSFPGPSVPALHARVLECILVVAAIFALIWLWASPTRRSPGLAAAYAGATVVLLVLWWRGWNTYLSHAGYELGAVLAVATASAALLARGPRRRELAFALVILLAGLGALDVPLDQGPRAIDRVRAGQPLSETGRYGLSRGLYQGLTWIREHTPSDAVLAVNNYREGGGTPTYFYYSAFAERRVFLEGWLFSAESWNVLGADALTSKQVPFPQRLRLDNRVFQHADRRALAVLRHDYGVRYLVADHVQGSSTPALAGLGRVAFANSAVTVYDVTAS